MAAVRAVVDEKKLRTVLKRGVAEIIVLEEFERLLRAGKPLRLKQGFDPSAPDIHLGHVVGLRKLRQLQELGHQVVLIVGDWTAQIGDPSGQSATRRMLSAEEVMANAETYMQQFFKVVDKAKTEVRWQTEWFGKFSLRDVFDLTRKFTVAQMLAREDFAKRYEAGRPIAITELLYPLLQAYDSVMVEADVELGGTDQKFNILLGRELQSMVGQRPQQVLLVPLLVGTDGTQKMSKSLGNYVGVTDPPNDMYGKVMSVNDALIMPYFELLTDVGDAELDEMRRDLAERNTNPMELKQRLAREIVAQFHGPHAAAGAQEHFRRVFQQREAPKEVTEYRISFASLPWMRVQAVEVGGPARGPEIRFLDWARLLPMLNLASSRAEARRLLAQGAVEVDGWKIDPKDIKPDEVKNGSIVRVGKSRFVKLVNIDVES